MSLDEDDGKTFVGLVNARWEEGTVVVGKVYKCQGHHSFLLLWVQIARREYKAAISAELQGSACTDSGMDVIMGLTIT